DLPTGSMVTTIILSVWVGPSSPQRRSIPSRRTFTRSVPDQGWNTCGDSDSSWPPDDGESLLTSGEPRLPDVWPPSPSGSTNGSSVTFQLATASRTVLNSHEPVIQTTIRSKMTASPPKTATAQRGNLTRGVARREL